MIRRHDGAITFISPVEGHTHRNRTKWRFMLLQNAGTPITLEYSIEQQAHEAHAQLSRVTEIHKLETRELFEAVHTAMLRAYAQGQKKAEEAVLEE